VSGDRTAARSRRGSPPDHAIFETAARAPALGTRVATLGLSTIRIAFDGMDDAWHAAFLSRYAPWSEDAAPGPGGGTVTFAAARGDADWFISPPEPGAVEVNPVWLAVEPDTEATGHWLVRVCTYGLAARFSTAGGRGLALFSREEVEPRERAVENVIRVTTAWLAVTRGGVLMHSASIVREDRGYLFFGHSGSGKSTLAAGSRRGRVVSDDLTLLLPAADGTPEIVGGPFRGTWTGGAPVTGRYPVVAAFRLVKAALGEPPAVDTARPALAMAGAMANLPFVVDQLHEDASLLAAAERVLSRIPIHRLRFGRDDDSWWDAIEAAGL